jgi:hypothetical protein
MGKQIERAQNECTWLESGDKSAPVRIRKILQDVKAAAHRVRMDVLSKSKSVSAAEDLENQSPKCCARNIPPEDAQAVSPA